MRQRNKNKRDAKTKTLTNRHKDAKTPETRRSKKRR